MKKNKFLVKLIICCLTAFIMLGACNDLISGNNNFGKIIINLSFQQERSIIPSLSPFEDYEISFESRDGKTPPPGMVITGTQASVSLDSGKWVIKAIGRISIGGVKKATAEGDSGEINIVQNITTPINISLYAKLEGDNGTISYNKTGFQAWPAAASASMTIISLKDDTIKATANLLSLVNSENPGSFSLEPGFYLMVIKAAAVQAGQDLAVREASISEVVHVYSNTETIIPFTKEDFTFVPSYTITAASSSNGSIQLMPSGTAPEGSTVTISVQSTTGYELTSLLVRYGNNESLPLTQISLTSYTFTMPGGNVNISATFAIPATFFEDFESSLSTYWLRSANVTITTQAAESPADGFFGNETQFSKLPAVIAYGGGTAFLERRVNPIVISALTFSFKTDIRKDAGQNFRLYINNTEKGSWDGLDFPWRTESILLQPGEQTIRFEVSSTGSYFPGGLNAIFIDNISLIPDITDSVVLYPRGALNSYVGVSATERIQFSAKALRSDGSIRNNASGFVFFGTGVNSSTGVFTPQAEGNVTVTVSLDGKTSSNNVTVHAADYIRQPYYYPGTSNTYNGYSGTVGSLTTNGGVTVTYPSAANFSADGFFTLEGTVNNPASYNYALIEVSKDSDPVNLTTSYFVRGDFKLRIWLRFGSGAYTIQVYGLANASGAFDLNGDGDWTGGFSYWGNPVTFYVTNTRNEGDMRFIYPSYLIQGDDFAVANLTEDLVYGLTDDTKKIKALHDYIIKNTVYDNDSLTPGRRKKQDALTVLGTRYFTDSQYNPGGHYLAVCEGYTLTFAALARNAGFEVRYVSSNNMSHAWNNIFINGAWRFLDLTWNDPSPDRGPSYAGYTYYLLSNLNGVNNSHTGWEVDQGRSVIGGLAPPWHRGVPKGWY